MLGSLGREFIVDDQVTFETIAWHTRQILKVPSIPFEIELFDLSDEPFDLSRFKRRVKLQSAAMMSGCPQQSMSSYRSCGGHHSGTAGKIFWMLWGSRRFGGRS